MERITFKSLGQAETRYLIVKDCSNLPATQFYNNPTAYVGDTCYQYDTLGDGDIQHSPEYLVSARDIEDFLVSLAIYISENHCADMLRVLEPLDPYGISADQIQFLYGIKLNGNGKSTYINLADMKKTTADKQYDKRWTKLPEDYKPDFDHIYPYFVQSFHGLLARLFIAEKIRHATTWSIYLDYEKSFQIANMTNIRCGMDILKAFVKAYSKLEYIERAVDSLKHNMSLNC